MFDVEFLLQGLRISVPYVLAAIGGVCSERSGVINIALEGTLLGGAFAFVLASHGLGSPAAGLVAAIVAGMLVSALHGFITISMRGDHIVSGVTVNVLLLALTDYGLKTIFHSASNSPRVNVIGADAAGVHPFVLAAGVAVLCVHVLLGRTVLGVRIRAVGERPEALDTLGLSVARLRYTAVLLSGLFAGLGGAYLANEQASFTSGMSAGRGYIALAAMIVGKWRPVPAMLAACLFGFAEAFQIRLQSHGVALPPQLVQSIPYALTLLVLCGFIGRATPPKALGVPYDRESP